MQYIKLKNRGIIEITGEDSETFLQGLITNDIKKAKIDEAIYALMLTPQGKYLYDFFIVRCSNGFILDCAAPPLIDALIKRFNMYKLRSKVEIKNVSDEYFVVAFLGDTSDMNGITYPDPRHSELFSRGIIKHKRSSEILKNNDSSEGTFEEYERLRISLGVPDGLNDLTTEVSFPMQYGMDKFAAIDFDKGCYVGQEVTARMKYRGNIRKGIFRITADCDLPDAGTDIMSNGKRIGEIRSSISNIGLALMDIEADKTDLIVAGIAINTHSVL